MDVILKPELTSKLFSPSIRYCSPNNLVQNGNISHVLSTNDYESYSKNQTHPGMLFVTVFLLLVETIELRQQGVSLKAENLQLNSASQNSLNKMMTSFQFSQLPSNATDSEVQKVQNQNEIIASQRSQYQSLLLSSRQSGQVLMTGASTDINFMQQSSLQNSEILKTLKEISTIISKIIHPS